MLSSVLQKIPLLIAGLMLLIAVVTIYFRSKNVTKSEFFKILKSVKADGFTMRLVGLQAKIKKLFLICGLNAIMEIA